MILYWFSWLLRLIFNDCIHPSRKSPTPRISRPCQWIQGPGPLKIIPELLSNGVKNYTKKWSRSDSFWDCFLPTFWYHFGPHKTPKTRSKPQSKFGCIFVWFLDDLWALFGAPKCSPKSLCRAPFATLFQTCFFHGAKHLSRSQNVRFSLPKSAP